jgi:hypothetical protein
MMQVFNLHILLEAVIVFCPENYQYLTVIDYSLGKAVKEILDIG